jgi:hypothetical protein
MFTIYPHKMAFGEIIVQDDGGWAVAKFYGRNALKWAEEFIRQNCPVKKSLARLEMDRP